MLSENVLRNLFHKTDKVIQAKPWDLFTNLDILEFESEQGEKAYIQLSREEERESLQIFVGEKAFHSLSYSFDNTLYASQFDYLEKELMKDCYILSLLPQAELFDEEKESFVALKEEKELFPAIRRQRPMIFPSSIEEDADVAIFMQAFDVILSATQYFPRFGKDKGNASFHRWMEEMNAENPDQKDYIPYAQIQDGVYFWKPIAVDWLSTAEMNDTKLIPDGPINPDDITVINTRKAKTNKGQIAYFDVFCPGLPVVDKNGIWRYCMGFILSDLHDMNKTLIHFFLPDEDKNELFSVLSEHLQQKGSPLAIKAIDNRSLALAEELFAPLSTKVTKGKGEMKVKVAHFEEQAYSALIAQSQTNN